MEIRPAIKETAAPKQLTIKDTKPGQVFRFTAPGYLRDINMHIWATRDLLPMTVSLRFYHVVLITGDLRFTGNPDATVELVEGYFQPIEK